MELVDDEDVETMIALYYGNGSDKNSPIHLFVELANMEQNEDLTAYGEEHATEEPCVVAPILYVDSESTIRGININLNVTPDIDVVSDDGYDNSDPCDEEVDSDSDPDVDDVPDDIDNEDVNDDGNINASSVGNQMRRVVIHNNPGPHMSLIDPDVAHEVEFPEYPEILPAHWLAVNSEHDELLARFQYQVSYRKAWIAKQMAMEQLYEDFDASYNELQGWIATMREYQQVNQIEAGHVFVEDVRDAMVANCRMARSMNVEIYSRCHETFRVTETIGRRPVYHLDPMELISVTDGVIAGACAKVNLNVEQFVDDVYTLERTLRVWENEFPVLPDLSTWEVPPTTFELVPNRGLRRNPRGHPQSSRIRNEMDIREKSDGKRCGLCRLAGHNRSKCLQ
ncbi:hypothetical protein GOBAR_AA15267 [Gossypium barbadense]|uniref:Uncharacterized protein n=1 Tax=Gossypium barbadense TaxID=3634 RepID=A0A2P5XPX4_GOSBA|nr:hypothetical protein GOBAR_AA15267 [Gossypium barbadense]